MIWKNWFEILSKKTVGISVQSIWTFFRFGRKSPDYVCKKYASKSLSIWTFFRFGRKSPDYVRELYVLKSTNMDFFRFGRKSPYYVREICA